MKIVFLLTHVPDPRMNKRIEIAKRRGEVVVICVRRASQDIWEPYHSDVYHEVINIDLPPAKQIVKRIILSKTYEKIAYALLKKYIPDIIYTEGLDSLGIASKYKKKRICKVVYEVADLRESFIEVPRSFATKIFTIIIKYRERVLFKCVDNLIVTSEKFYEIHYSKLISKDRTIFIPNIPDDEPFREYQRKKNGEFTVGFIGGIRYLKQMKMLVDAAVAVGCNVLFAGAGGTSDDYRKISDYCKNLSNIMFTGKYQYNRDIANLYGRVNCVYAVYDADNPNVRIALPNKLYEAVKCSLPIIVSKKTYLSETVESWGVGVSVSHNDTDDLIRILKEIIENKDLYNKMIERCQVISDELRIEKFNDKLESIFIN